MEIEFDLSKSIEENVGLIYEKVKRLKKKKAGIRRIIERMQKEVALLKQKRLEKIEEEKTKEKVTKREEKWYERFRWFHSSEGFLCVGGRDAVQNEILIKKHVEHDDLIFHAEIHGSPFFIVKQGKKAGKATLKEAAEATASYSRAWRLGLMALDVFYIKPGQISKKAPAGTFLPKGSFMIQGKKNFFRGTRIALAIGIKDSEIISGPIDAVKAQTLRYVVIVPGKKKQTELARSIQRVIGGSVDQIVRFLPSGPGEIIKGNYKKFES